MASQNLNEFSSSADKEETRVKLEVMFNENAHRFQKGYDEGAYTVKTQGSIFIVTLQSEDDYFPRRIAEINFNSRAVEQINIKVSKYNTKDYMEKIIKKILPAIEL